jgi:GNAT superfamily N-acetyltransferase
MQPRRRAFEIRAGTEPDARKLEWDGEFSHHRAIIEHAFSAQRQGEGLVLVGTVDESPVAQLWARFEDPNRPPRFWAFRVMISYRGLGIGSALLQFGERELAKRNFQSCEIGTEKDNIHAFRFYQERGYCLAYPQVEDYGYGTPSGEWRTGRADQWILAKRLELPQTPAISVDRPPGNASPSRLYTSWRRLIQCSWRTSLARRP